MNLAIIAAGESSRIKSEGLNKSKLMINIKDEYLIERIIRIARNNDIEKVFCIINSREPELESFLLSTDFSIELQVIIKDTESSMHSLFELSPFIGDAPFILTTSDAVFIESEFNDFIKFSLLQENTDGILAVTGYIDDEKPLCILMDDEGKITKFSDSSIGYNWATGGIYYFSPDIFEQKENALNLGITRLRNFLRLLISNSYVLKGFPFSKIIDVDHVSDIRIAEEFINKMK